MDIRLVVLITAGWFAVSSGPARAELQPKNPDQAPIATVDRFSDRAGKLLVRSADKRLPSPNQPIDFDTPPFNVLGFSPTGEPTLYYHLDVQSTTPAPVYILYRDGEDRPVQNQLDVIDTLPGEQGYNDFQQVWKVWAPKDYVANTITDDQCCSKQATRWKRPLASRVHNLETALKAKVVPAKVLLINCPIVSIEH